MDAFQTRQQWLERWLNSNPSLGFIYGNNEFEDEFDNWKKEYKTNEKEGFSEHIVSYTDPKTHLTTTCFYKSYNNYPAIEILATLKNNGEINTPIIENLLPLQKIWEVESESPAILHYPKGSDHQVDDFIPLEKELKHWEPLKLTPIGGRSSDGILPFFNLEVGKKGIILAIGWTGQWQLTLIKNQPNNESSQEISIESGMEHTHLTLFPKETIRTPRILLLFWEGDRLDAHNLFRSLVISHYSPKIDGKRARAPLSYPTWGGTSISEHKKLLSAIKKHNLAYEYYWVDAGWYLPDEEKEYHELTGSWAKYVGRWKPNSILYPNGLEELSEEIHKIGLKFLLWFEPERAVKGSDWTKEYPEYFLSDSGHTNLLFDLGNPEARQFLIDFISDRIERWGIDCYRQDFNFSPLRYWQAKDSPDRQGIAEIRHIEGLYIFWDTLLSKFPHLLIDNCSSGGRRIDLETNSRSIPLWRSDLQCFDDFSVDGSHIHTYGLSFWVPLSSTGTRYRVNDTYNVRSAFSSGLVFHHGSNYQYFDDSYPWKWHEKMINEFKRARNLFEGNFYPLTDCDISKKGWIGYQYHSEALDKGFILCFRHEDSPFIQANFKLRGLSQGTYIFEDVDLDEKQTFTDDILINMGLNITIDHMRESKLIFYSKESI